MNSVIITISVPTLISELFGKKYFAQILSYSRMSGIIGCFGAAAVGACYDLTGSYMGSFVARRWSFWPSARCWWAWPFRRRRRCARVGNRPEPRDFPAETAVQTRVIQLD